MRWATWILFQQDAETLCLPLDFLHGTEPSDQTVTQVQGTEVTCKANLVAHLDPQQLANRCEFFKMMSKKVLMRGMIPNPAYLPKTLLHELGSTPHRCTACWVLWILRVLSMLLSSGIT